MNDSSDILIEPVAAPTSEVRALIAELDRTLSAEYPPEQRHGLALDAIFQPHVRFFVGYLDGEAVACGGVALFDDFAEVKRMYVREAARGYGVARALLQRIETETRSAGLSMLRLETGDRQGAAMRLYTHAGFRQCNAFGAYAAMRPDAIATSVFFEKPVGVAIRPITENFGAEIIGLDLSHGLDDAAFRCIEQAWFDASFLVFRNLVMTPDQHIAFTRLFGPLHIMTPLHYNHPDHPEVMVLSNLEEGGKPLGIRRAGMGWHSDGEDKQVPNAGSFLYAHVVPPEGGDTLFADMYAAYEALPETMKQRIAGRRARFSRVDMHHVHYPHEPALTEEQKRERPDVFHPLVRTHPRAGRKSLYIGRWARDVEGIDPDEGRALIEELFAHASSERFVYRHRWRTHDAVLWDNRCMLHSATPFDERRHTRLMHRTTLEGDVPI